MDPTRQFLTLIGALDMTRIVLLVNETPDVEPEDYLIRKIGMYNNPMEAVNSILLEYTALGNMIFKNLYGINDYEPYNQTQLQIMGQIFLNRVRAPEFVSLLLNPPDSEGRNIVVAVQRLENRLIQDNMDSLSLFNSIIYEYVHDVVRPTYNRLFEPQPEPEPEPQNVPHPGPYGILGLEMGASIGDIKKAYKKLSLKYHPDRNRQKSTEEQENASEMMKDINKAYGTLTKRGGKKTKQTKSKKDRKKTKSKKDRKKPKKSKKHKK